jgi:hypothetical protein
LDSSSVAPELWPALVPSQARHWPAARPGDSPTRMGTEAPYRWPFRFAFAAWKVTSTISSKVRVSLSTKAAVYVDMEQREDPK